MSYSFGFQAKTKDEARAVAAAKFDEVILIQAVHAADKAAALANLDGALSVVPDTVEGRELAVSMNGYLSWTQSTSEPTEFSGVSVATSVSWITPQPAQPAA